MFPYLRLGPVSMQTPGLALLAGVWIGLLLAERRAARLKMDASQVYNLVFSGLLVGIIAARLGYAARYLDAYLASPLSLVSLDTHSLDPLIGLAGGLLAFFIDLYRRKLPFRRTLDVLAPGLAAFLVSLGLAHLLSGDAFGSATRLPWAVYLWGEYRHPTQVYEILLALAVFFLVWKHPLEGQGEGLDFALFLALSAGVQVFIMAFRGDSTFLPGGFRAGPVIGLAVLALALWLLDRWRHPQETVFNSVNLP